ncbi:MAG: recombination mediator RecR [Christensenellales bacterium]|jgi:recombination protein RecR
MGKMAEPLAQLINELGKLPGIGPRSAARMAYFLLDQPEEEVRRLAEAIWKAKKALHSCSVCQNFTDTDPCAFCADPSRDDSLICVVEQPRDVEAMEKTREFRGRYHVLHGTISPRDGRGPEDIRLPQLLSRLGESVREVIVATSPNVEGEATALYIARLLKPLGMKVSRIASGLPVGSDLEYADQVTLGRAILERREM